MTGQPLDEGSARRGDAPTEERTGYRSGAPTPHFRRADSVTSANESHERVGFCCDLCGTPMLDLHCKLVCPSCGYQRDCSDP